MFVDPLAEKTMEPYSYTGNNPIMFTDPTGMSKVGLPDPPGFWGSFFGSVARGVGAVVNHVVNNPNHAGYGYHHNMKKPSVSDFSAYQINWGQQLDPTWQIKNFSSLAIEGVTGFVGGIVENNGTKTARAIPNLVGTFGVFSTFRSKGIKSVDLMGGSNTSLRNFKNFDPLDDGLGINDYVSNFSKYFKPGSIKNIVVNNPQASFLEEISSSVARGGHVTVRGTMNNPNFNKIFNGTANGLDDFKEVSREIGLPNEGYYQTGGIKRVGGQNNINEIILQKL